MLWSFIKIVIFVALVAAMTLGAGFLIESEGQGLAEARIVLNGVEYSFGPLQIVIGLLLLLALGYILFKLAGLVIAGLKFVNGDETALSRYFDRNRERKGYQALSEGIMALASGEGRLAIAKAQKAERYLGRPELTELVTAQASEQLGDFRRAEESYKKLVQREETRFVGIRGLMRQKLDKGDTDTARQLAERAFALKPKHEEVQDTLLQLQAKAHDWTGARKTLTAKLKHGGVPRDLYKRRDAVLAVSEAADVVDPTKSIEIREAAIKANKNSPDLIPAATMAARGYIAEDRKKNAVRVIKKAWEMMPHPDLAAAFAEIEPQESPTDRVKRFRLLTSIRPEDRETRLLQAELNLAAEDFPAARRALGDLVEQDPDQRVLAIMAAVERGEGASEEVVRGWLAKALTAPRGPQWVCTNCNAIQGDWIPICSNCGGFDTLTWTRPPKSEGSLPAGVDMLPLLVGASSEKPAESGTVIEVNPTAERDVTPPAEIEDAQTVEPTKEAAK